MEIIGSFVDLIGNNGPEPDEPDHAGVEDFAVYRSPGTLPEPGGREVRLGAIVVRGTPVRFPSSQDIPAGSPIRFSLPRDSDTRVDRQMSSTSKANRFDFGERGPPIWTSTQAKDVSENSRCMF